MEELGTCLYCLFMWTLAGLFLALWLGPILHKISNCYPEVDDDVQG